LAQYSNPNQQGGGGMDSSKLLTYLIIFFVFFLGMKYFLPAPKPAQEAQQIAPAQQQQSAAPAAISAPAAHAPIGPATAAPAETETVVENSLYRIRFTNRGAQVTSWILKNFKDNHGQPLDIVHTKAAAQFGYPLSLYTSDANTRNELSQALYLPSATGTLSSPANLSFEYTDGNGLVAHKTFTFDNSYVIHADTQVTQNGAPVRAYISWPAAFGDQEYASNFATTQIDSMKAGKEDHTAAKKISNDGTMEGPLDWAGVSDLHFAAIFLPDNIQSAQLATFNHGFQPADAKSPLPALGAGLADENGRTQTRIYVGPKIYSLLSSIHATGADGAASGPSLVKIIDFGFFGPIAKFLFLALFAVYKLTHNWGWAIIVLTVIINICLLPVRITTMKSALKMQRIQPQMDVIKAKYAKYKVTDPKRQDMNTEIMKLQKDNGVNMFGGCIPNLLQFPLLIAFITMLPKVTELRLTHWYWLPDLTAKDPLHILPIIMIVTMFLVQYYMPSPGVDPQQQKMMAFMMPVISGVFVWNYASGPGIYWATGNVIMIIQQLAMNRTAVGREMRDIAARRARRKAGVGTIQGKR
jgi:YidC/Oxa1 family membrane protein insertase